MGRARLPLANSAGCCSGSCTASLSAFFAFPSAPTCRRHPDISARACCLSAPASCQKQLAVHMPVISAPDTGQAAFLSSIQSSTGSHCLDEEVISSRSPPQRSRYRHHPDGPPLAADASRRSCWSAPAAAARRRPCAPWTAHIAAPARSAPPAKLLHLMYTRSRMLSEFLTCRATSGASSLTQLLCDRLPWCILSLIRAYLAGNNLSGHEKCSVHLQAG